MFDWQMIEIWQKQYSKLCKRSFNSLYFILFLSILFHRTVFSRFLHGFLFNIWHIIYHWKALIPLFPMGWLTKWNSHIFFTFSKISYSSPVQLVLFKILVYSRECKHRYLIAHIILLRTDNQESCSATLGPHLYSTAWWMAAVSWVSNDAGKAEWVEYLGQSSRDSFGWCLREQSN